MGVYDDSIKFVTDIGVVLTYFKEDIEDFNIEERSAPEDAGPDYEELKLTVTPVMYDDSTLAVEYLYTVEGETTGHKIVDFNTNEVLEESGEYPAMIEGLKGASDEFIVEYTVKNGKLNGEATISDFEGRKRAVNTYKDGVPDGPQRVYDPDGNLRRETTIRHDGPSVTRIFDADGSMIEETTFDASAPAAAPSDKLIRPASFFEKDEPAGGEEMIPEGTSMSEEPANE
jgi:antitoxin component YwqK of YwqJK toxin-antitoxin module